MEFEEKLKFWELERRTLDERGFWAPPRFETWTAAETIAAARRLCCVSQEELAAMAGLSQGNVSRLEASANPNWASLALCAGALGFDALLRLRPRRPIAELIRGPVHRRVHLR